MERWAKSVNAAKTQLDDSKKGTAAATSKSEELKAVEADTFKVVSFMFIRFSNTEKWVEKTRYSQVFF